MPETMPTWDESEPIPSWEDSSPIEERPVERESIDQPATQPEMPPAFAPLKDQPPQSSEELGARNTQELAALQAKFPGYGMTKPANIWETVNTPLLEAHPGGGRFLGWGSENPEQQAEIIRIATEGTGTEKAALGLRAGAEEFLSGLTSPVGLATVGVAPLLKSAPLIGKALNAYFGFSMGKDLAVDVAQELGSEYAKPPDQRDQTKITKLWTRAALGAPMVGALGADIMERSKPPAPESMHDTGQQLERTIEPAPIPPTTRDAIQRAAEVGLNKSAAALAKQVNVTEVSKPTGIDTLESESKTPETQGLENASNQPNIKTGVPSGAGGRGGIDLRIVQTAGEISRALREGDVDGLQHALSGPGMDPEEFRRVYSQLSPQEQAAVQEIRSHSLRGSSLSDAAAKSLAVFDNQTEASGDNDKIPANETGPGSGMQERSAVENPSPETPITQSTQKIKQERKQQNARENISSTTLYGSLREFPIASEGEVPAAEGGGGIQPRQEPAAASEPERPQGGNEASLSLDTIIGANRQISAAELAQMNDTPEGIASLQGLQQEIAKRRAAGDKSAELQTAKNKVDEALSSVTGEGTPITEKLKSDVEKRWEPTPEIKAEAAKIGEPETGREHPIIAELEKATAAQAENEIGPRIAKLTESEKATTLKAIDERYKALTEQGDALNKQAEASDNPDALITQASELHTKANVLKSAADIARQKVKPLEPGARILTPERTKELSDLVKAQKPLPAAELQEHSLKIPPGYVLEGENYVFKGEPILARPGPKEPKGRKSIQEFDRLVQEYGEQLGWIENPDAIAGISGAKSGHSTASVKGDIAGKKELYSSLRKAIRDLGGDPSKIKTRGELLQALKDHIAEYEAMEVGAHSDVEGVTAPGFVPVEGGAEAATEPGTHGAEPAAAPPKLAAGEKGTGDLFKGTDQPFNLAGETGIDTERVASEKAAAEKRAAEAKAAQEKQQPALPGTESTLPEAGLSPARPGEFGKEPELPQLTRSLETLADATKGTESTKAFSLGETLSRAKDTVSAATDGLRAAASYVKRKLIGKPVWTKFLDALGDRHLALSESTANAKKWLKTVTRAMPNVRTREAISNWIDAGGDMDLLERAASETKPQYRKGYEDAKTLTPEQKTIAENLKNYFESRLQDAQEAGILEDGIENYIHRVYEQDSPWRQGILTELKSGIFTGKPALAKKRLFEYDFEAEKAGKRPVKDFAKRVAAYDLALNKAIADRAAVKAMMEIKMPDGRPMIDVGGGGKIIRSPERDAQATLINRTQKPTGGDVEAERGDYRSFDHPSLRKWKWATTDDAGNPIFVQGDVLIHPDALPQVTKLFKPSAIAQSKVGRTALKVSSTIKQTMLDLSGFHPVQITVHGWEHRQFSPVKEIDFNDPATRGLIRGGLVVGETSGQHLFSEGLAGSSLTRHVPVIGKRLQAFNEWLFSDYIPRLKVATGLHALERNRAKFKDLSEDELNHLTATQMNNAFGELNYEMMGRSKTTQDVLRMALLAPDFLEARSKFVAQAGTKYGAEQRNALLLGAAAMYITARIVNKLLDDEYHLEPKNAFNIVHNGRAYSLRTVQGDLIHLLTEPGQFINHRLNPATTKPALEFVTGRDYFGRKRSGTQQLKDLAKTPIPIALQGMFSGREQTLFDSFRNAVGLVTRRDSPSSDMSKLADEFKSKNKIVTTPGEFIYDAEKDPFRKIRLAAERDDEATTRSEIGEALKAGLSRKQIRDHFERSQQHYFTGSAKVERKFKESLSEDQKKIYQDSVEERKRIRKLVIKSLH